MSKKQELLEEIERRAKMGNGPPPKVTEGFGIFAEVALFAVFAGMIAWGLYEGDPLMYFGFAAFGGYLLWCYYGVHQGKFGLVLVNNALTGEILEHGGHILWRPFQSFEERDSEESNTDVEFRSICADNVEAWGTLSVPSRESYNITDKEGCLKAYKIEKAERDERTRAFTLVFTLWLLKGLTTEQFIRHQAGFARAVGRALRYSDFPEALGAKLSALTIAKIAEWPLVIVQYFDEEVASVFNLVAQPAGAASLGRREEEARESFAPLEIMNGREVRAGVSLLKADYDRDLKKAQAAKAAARSVIAEFNELASGIKAASPNFPEKDLVGAVLAAMSRGEYRHFSGLDNITQFQYVGK